jgi:hypothetical protein
MNSFLPNAEYILKRFFLLFSYTEAYKYKFLQKEEWVFYDDSLVVVAETVFAIPLLLSEQ